MFPLDVGDIVKKICKDSLFQSQARKQFDDFLSCVEVPFRWKDKRCKLDQGLPTYKYRLQILNVFVARKEEGGKFLTRSTCKEFFDELKQFSLDPRDDDDAFWEHDNGQNSRHGVDLFQENVKLQGVVVRKSEKRLKASVLVKKEGCNEQTGVTSDSMLSELVVNLQREDQPGEEFHLKVSVGDVVEVTQCRRKEGEALRAEVVMCYFLSDDQIQSYLKCLSSCVKSGHSIATVNEILRCHAAWNYVLELSKEKYDENIILQILETVDKISSTSPVLHTAAVRKITQGFQQSSFFRTILPDFIDKVTEMNCFSLVQNILEQVISAVPQSGLQTLTLAKNLADKYLEVSSDDETTTVIMDFLIQLSTIIASEVPGALKNINELPWKQLPLIPDEEEIKNPKKGGEFVTTSTCKELSDELKQFSLDSRDDDDEFWEHDNGHNSCHGVDLFQQNVKLQGVVVRKSEKRLKASVLVKKEGCNDQTGVTSDSMPSELVVNLQREDKLGEEFHLKVSVGDVVEVTQCRRKEGEALRAEVVMCYSLSDDEIQSYLKCVSSRVKSGQSIAAVNEILRCRAAWNYTLELSKERYDANIILQILEAVNKISSTSLVLHTVRKIVQGFQQSSFFRTILPDFIDKVTEMDCFSLVRNILKHVVSAVPQSGLQILTLAKKLAYKQLEVASNHETPKVIVDFLIQLSTIIASKVPGALKNIKELPWKQLPLIPDEEEMKNQRLKTDDLPVIKKDKKDTKYESEGDYLNTYFRLLREECFYKLRKGISDFFSSGQKCDSKDLRMYRISLKEASLCHEDSPTPISICLEYKRLGTQANSDMEHAESFMYGNLVCISIDGTFREPVLAVVDKCIDQSIVRISLCDKGNAISEPQFIAKMQEIHNRGEEAAMAESQTFYLSYAPALEVLQNRDYVPFKEFLVFADLEHMKHAEYINQIKSPPDWGIIFQGDSLPDRTIPDEPSEKYSLLEDFDELRLNGSCKPLLDESQLYAVELALKKKLVLIQGPPGTGKSHVGVALVNLLMSMNVPHDHGPILVVTYKNHALDNFMSGCVKKVSSPDAKIVRVGRVREDADEELKNCLLREVGRQWPQRLYNQKRKLLGQMRALQPKVNRAFEKLRYSSSFTADMFLKEAPESLLKSLLIESPQMQMKEAELDVLINEGPKSEAKLREMVKKALLDWLPSKEVFNSIVQTDKGSSPENSSPGKGKGEQMKDSDQEENPSDVSDPSVEQNERLLAIDEEITDDDYKVIAEKLESQASGSSPANECLLSLVCIDKSKVESFKYPLDVTNVWKWEERKKIQLVCALQRKFYDKASTEFLNVSDSYAELHHRLKELRNEHNIEVMRKCHVIGMTVTGATMRANLLDDIKPSVMIVEEAAEILEGQLVAAIPSSVQHLVMIGDHMQLKPIVHFPELRKHNHLDVSMFERLATCNLPFTQLQYQCRMRDELLELLRELKVYKGLKTNEKLVKDNAIPPCVTRGMYFWTHTKLEEDKFSHSKRNSCEAEKITEVAKTFCQEGRVPPSKITVLCSYRGQVPEIKKCFKDTEIPALENVKVTTIDSFQGQENDIILISLVRSNSKGKIGYLSQMNRLCVAISRARCGLYLFGNHTQLGRASEKGWKVVNDAMRKAGCLGRTFPFRSFEDSNIPKQGESGPVGSSPSRETESKYVINISGQDNCINIGDGTVTTINIRNDDPRPVRLEKPSPTSAKTPVQHPETPTGYRPEGQGASPTQEAGLDRGKMAATTKDAREPIQQFEKSGETRYHAPSSTQEAGSDTRELESPTKDAREPIQEIEKSTEPELLDVEAGLPTKEARETIQVSTSKDGAEVKKVKTAV
ncbi:PREDICTED: NFX1-type zinc finger-containing protein 1-like [Acropora digitifera]|uniref:NFX1-type zinc finger-containing protein 1-like n=1 Tax=Acropora digitifera TaxID=70779 RepID=UPI00077AFE45|nr:PREDICTED: NFX1-type zinc finger-containing protein 1-like [Acropora digitifera]